MKSLMALLCLCIGVTQVKGQGFTNYQESASIIGQANSTAQSLTTNNLVTARVSAAAISPSGVFAAACQYSPARIMIWNQTPKDGITPANLVLGQASFTSSTTGCSASSFQFVNGVTFSPDGRKMIVCDNGNNRVLIWNQLPTSNNKPADVVIGQPNFTTSTANCSNAKLRNPVSCAISNTGKVYIVDQGNNRIMVWNTLPTTNGQAADFVIGQADFTSSASGTTASSLSSPWQVTLSETGKLFITDFSNNRVLLFNQEPTTFGASANVVIGQNSMTTRVQGTSANGLFYPIGVTVNSTGKLFISEFSNNRVLVFNNIPSSNYASADVVLGQPDFTSKVCFSGGINNRNMCNAYLMASDASGAIYVPGRAMNRIMVFKDNSYTTTDLDLTMLSAAPSVCAGRANTIQIVLKNKSNTASGSFTVKLTSDIAAQLVSRVRASQGNYNAQQQIWTGTSVAANSTDTLTLIFNLPSTYSATSLKINSVIQHYAHNDLVMTNNSASLALNLGAPVNFNVATQDLACNAQNTGRATLNLPRSSNDYRITWSTGQQNINILENLPQGTYSVQVESTTGCLSQHSFEIKPTSIPTAQYAVSEPLRCFNGTGKVNIQATNGFAPYTGTGLVNVSAGQNALIVADANGCTDTVYVNMPNPPAMSVGISSTPSNCGQADGAIALNLSQVAAPASLLWQDNRQTHQITQLRPGLYTATITDGIGCKSIKSVSLSSTSPILKVVEESSTNVNCYAGNDGTATVTVNSTNSLNYRWTSNETTNSARKLRAGTNIVTITDASGCIITKEFVISEPAKSIEAIAKTHVATCQNLSKFAWVEVNNAQGNLRYQWSNGQTDAQANDLTSGYAYVTVTDAKNCSSVARVNVLPSLASPQIAAQIIQPACYNSSNGSINLNATSPNGATFFLWTNGQTASRLEGLAPNTYEVQAVDTKGCTTSQIYTIVAPQRLNAATIYNQTNNNNTIQVTGGTAPYHYNWPNGSNSVSQPTNLTAGRYQVTVIDSKGCNTSTIVEILALPSSSATVSSIESQNEVTPALINAYFYENTDNTEGFVKVTLPQTETSNVQIYAANGQLVSDTHYTEQQYTIQLPSLASGVYFTRISTQTATTTVTVRK